MRNDLSNVRKEVWGQPVMDIEIHDGPIVLRGTSTIFSLYYFVYWLFDFHYRGIIMF